MEYDMPVPGWYPDPSGAPGRVRYWDGQVWTGNYAVRTGDVMLSEPQTAGPLDQALMTIAARGGRVEARTSE